jgi:hypothetical protein
MIRDPKVQEARPREGFPLYLLTALAIGLVAGLLIAWLFFPVRPSGISPAELPRLDKENYRTQIAMAYAATGDANRAAARLNLLGDIDPIRELNIQAQLALLSQDTQREARALSQLAQAIYEIVLERFSEEAETGILMLPESVYTLTEVQNLCEGAAAVPLLRVFVLDAEGNPQSDTPLMLSSIAGEEESATGLIPEQGAGYAEFNLFPDENYQLSIGSVLSVSGILTPSCQDEDENESYWGSQLITLRANP